jgi:hypothetical protein
MTARSDDSYTKLSHLITSRLDQMGNDQSDDSSERRQLYEAVTPHHARLEQMGNNKSDDLNAQL